MNDAQSQYEEISCSKVVLIGNAANQIDNLSFEFGCREMARTAIVNVLPKASNLSKTHDDISVTSHVPSMYPSEVVVQ